MSLYQYLVRLETVLLSRQDIEVELLEIDITTIGVKFKSEMRFYEGSRLSMVEQLELTGRRLDKLALPAWSSSGHGGARQLGAKYRCSSR